MVSQKVNKYKTVIRPSNSTHSVPNQEKEKHSLHKDLNANVHSSIIQIPPPKGKTLEKTSLSIQTTELITQQLKGQSWASLVVQWLRVRLPMQGTRVRAPVREDPTCRGAAGPVSHGC